MNTLMALILIFGGGYTIYSATDGIEIVETTKIISQKGEEIDYSKIEKDLKDEDNSKINIKNLSNIIKNNDEIKKVLDTIKNNNEIKEILSIKRDNDKNENIEIIFDTENKINENNDFVKLKVHNENCNCISICKK